MSVINQMLKELDQRKTPAHAGVEAAMPASNMMQNNQSRYLIPLLVIIVILMLVTIYYLKFPDSGNAVVVEKPKEINSVISSKDNQIVESAPNLKQKTDNLPLLKTEEIVQVQIKAPEIHVADTSIEETSPVIVPKNNSPTLEQQIEPPIQTVVTDTKIVKSTIPQDPKQQADRFYRNARQKINIGQTAAAIELLEKALNSSGDFHKARILLFSILLQQQQITILQPRLDVSLSRWPIIYEYRQMKARLLSFQHKNEAALELLQSNVPTLAEAPEYHGLVAYVAQQIKNDVVAVKHYRMLLEQNSDRADWWLGLAVSEDRMGNSEAALEAYRYAVDRRGLSQSVQKYALDRIKALQGF